MFQLVHAGFDGLSVAFKGTLPVETIDYLKKERNKATEQQEPVLVQIGPDKVKAHLAGHGLSGGYAFVLNTGPIGEQWQFKASSDPGQWNIFAKPYAETLAAHGYREARDQMFRRLDAMRCRFTEHAINRVDFAMDFLTETFEPSLDRFVGHSRAKVRPHWSKEQDAAANQPAAVLCGRRLESVTIGKMPGRQVIVYDKRRDAIAKQKLFWFKVWNIGRHCSDREIWRVEIRAGKKELKDRWNIRTFEDVENSIGDVFRHALEEVRYLDHGQTDGNVTRQRLHPLWTAARAVLERELTECRSGLTPGQILEIERDLAKDRYRRLIQGNGIGYAVCLGLDDERIAARFPEILREVGASLIADSTGHLAKMSRRTRERLHFLSPRSGDFPEPLS